jgi:ADP-ribose pyrophosphatase
MADGIWDKDESWPVAESVDLHRDGWVMALRADRINRPGHAEEEPFRRLVLEHPGSAVVLAVDADERVLVLTQYRHPAGRRLAELPAGLIDAEGEDPLDVARRELREEAAYAAAEWRHLLSAYSSPGISAEQIHYYLARELTPVDRGGFVLEHEEAEMALHWVPVDELIDAVLDGRAADAPLAVAVLAYDALRRRAALDA